MQDPGSAPGGPSGAGPPKDGKKYGPPTKEWSRLDPHVRGMLESKFSGASGPVQFERDAHDTVRESGHGAAFGAFNLRMSTSEAGQTTYKYENVLTAVWRNNEWSHKEPFRYPDGSYRAPSLIRSIDNNYLSEEVRISGLALMGFAWLLSLICIVATWFLKEKWYVRSAQPVFMIGLCLGSAILATSIYTLSWDEGTEWTDIALDRACMMTPWFFFIGHVLTFCCIFTKLWRVDKVLQFRRVKVQLSSVTEPLVILLSLTVLVLTLWTVLDPWVWERDDDLDAEDFPESHGKCTNGNAGHWWAFFGPLAGLLVVSEGITLVMAFKTTDIP